MSHTTPRFRDDRPLSQLWQQTLGEISDLASCPADRSYRPGEHGDADGEAATINPAGFVRSQIIGRGGNGRVYRAEQLDLQREVALKTIQFGSFDPRVRRAFLAEAVTVGRLEHPNIVPVHSLGASPEGELFLAMKLIDGENWADHIRRGEASLDEQLEILIQVCNAIAFAHSRNVVHNDLKPENVMLGRFGEVLVVDWGSAVYVGDKSGNETLRHHTDISRPCGTPSCMAPEQAFGRGDSLGPATDAFLLGASLHMILTGRPLHVGKNLLEVCAQLNPWPQPEFDSDVPRELAAICREAVSFQIEERPTVAELQQKLRGFLTHRQSRRISAQARQLLDELATAAAPRAEDGRRPYERFSAAITGFATARQLWEENPEALAGEREARIAYAQAALQRGDVGLAESQAAHIDEDSGAHAALVRAIDRFNERRAREQRARRRQWRLLVLAGLVLGVCLPLVLVLLSQTRDLHREREASDLERQGLASQSPGQGIPLLRRAVELDPSRSVAWRALARLQLRAGDPASARASCEQALALAANDPTLTALRAEALEMLAQEEAALTGYLRAYQLGERDDRMSLHLARLLVRRGRYGEALPLLNTYLRLRSADSLALGLRASCYAGLGSLASAEEDRWTLLRQTPTTDRLANLLLPLIEADDLAGLPRLWQEIYRRMADGAGLFKVSVQAYDRLLRECSDSSVADAQRVASCLALSLFGRNGSRQALREVMVSDPNPLLAEAARASLLILQPEQGLRWWTEELASAAARPEQPRTGGAAAALTLLEAAPSLDDADLADLLPLTRAEGWLVRAALPITLALARSEPRGLSHEASLRLLAGLAHDPHPLVRRKAEAWQQALNIFEHPWSAAPANPSALALAVRLCLRPGERAVSRRQAVFELMDSTLAHTADAELLYLRACLRLEAGEAEACEADLRAALRLDPEHRTSADLLLQLRLARDGSQQISTELSERDPVAAAGIAMRAAFMRRSGMVVLPGPHGTVRASVHLGGNRTALDIPGFDISTVGAAMVPAGLRSSGPTRLLSSFTASEWYSVEVSGPDRGALMLDTDRYTRWGIVCGSHAEATYIKIDAGEQIFHQVYRQSVQVQNAEIWRSGIRLLYDGQLSLEHAASARTVETQGLFKMVYGYGFETKAVLRHWQGVFRLLDIETRPSLPPASTLTEMAPATPLVMHNLASPPARELADLWRGIDLPFVGRWIAEIETAPMLFVQNLRGDLEALAQVEFEIHGVDLGAGVAFRSARGMPQAVRLFLCGPSGASPYPASVQLATQVGLGWEFPVAQVPWQGTGPAQLVLRRQGDYIVALCGEQNGPLAPVGDPVYFPLDEPVEAGLFARTNGAGDGTVHFEQVTVLSGSE